MKEITNNKAGPDVTDSVQAGEQVATPAAEFEYLLKLPSSVPAGRFLVHNRVQPASRPGVRGFRCWYVQTDAGIEVCPCAWAPELGPHYRIERPA